MSATVSCVCLLSLYPAENKSDESRYAMRALAVVSLVP